MKMPFSSKNRIISETILGAIIIANYFGIQLFSDTALALFVAFFYWQGTAVACVLRAKKEKENEEVFLTAKKDFAENFIDTLNSINIVTLSLSDKNKNIVFNVTNKLADKELITSLLSINDKDVFFERADILIELIVTSVEVIQHELKTCIDESDILSNERNGIIAAIDELESIKFKLKKLSEPAILKNN